MAETTALPTNRIVEYGAVEGKTVDWICMDDRPAIHDNPYHQIAGGAQGVGLDAAIAIDMAQARTGNISSQAAAAHVIAGLAAAIASGSGIRLLNHKGCAAEEAAAVVSEKIRTDPETVLPIAQRIMPSLTKSQYVRVAAAHTRLHIAPIDVAQDAADNGCSYGLLQIPAVERVALIDAPHAAGKLLANYQKDVAFDAAKALEDGNPAYHLSLGDLPELMAALTAFMPFDHQDFLAANAIRTAATSTFLPKPNGQDITIHIV